MIRCDSCFGMYSEEFEICPECGYYNGKEEDPIYRLPHGTIVKGRYKIGKTIGSGGFGITYKAWDLKLETVVAVKEFYPVGIVNRVPGSKEMFLISKRRKKDFENTYIRFLDEARNMAKFNGHANIVNAFEYFEENQTAYIVMEYLDGMDLKKYLSNMGEKLDVNSCINIMTEVCKAIEALHEKSIIHRDVSTDNIRICQDGRIKIIDFGAARFADSDDTSLDIVLKPGYAPPEQYDKVKPQGPWTDTYAVGATMYRMITGQMPEESTNRVIEDKLLYPHEIDESIPFNISCAIMKAMAVEKHMRFSNIDEFRKALLGEKKVMHLAKEKKRRKRRRFITVASAVTVLLVGFGIFSWNWEKQKEEETLPEATIDIFLLKDDFGSGKQIAFEAVKKSFIESYPDVTINITSVEEGNYEEELKKALNSDNPPEIYQAYGEYDKGDIEVTDIVKDAKKDIVMYKEVLENAKDNNIVTLGFEFPVVYVNKGKEEVESLDEAIEVLEIEDIEEKTYLDDFLEGREKYYIGTNRCYGKVQQKLAGVYKVFVAGKDYECKKALELAVNECSEEEMKCAIRFLKFCYSDNAQDNLFIMNQTGALPINKNALEVYEKYNKEFSGFFEDINKYDLE